MSRLHISRPGLVIPRAVDPSGVAGPTRGQARGPNWRRTSPGLFVPASVASSVPEQRIVEVAAGTPPGAAVTGWAALHWLGAQWFDGTAADGSPRAVDVALGDQRTMAPRPGLRISEQWVPAGHVIEVDGLRVTRPEFSAWHEARAARAFVRGVMVLDMVVGQDLASLEDLGCYVADYCKGRPGIKRFRSMLLRADENVWSPQETLMRMDWIAVTGRTPACNVPIFDLHGHHLLTTDLLDIEHGVAGEYDGLHHLADGRRRRDLDREEVCREYGIESVTMMTGGRRDRAAFAQRLLGALRRGRDRPGRRLWTTDQPAWWVDTSTVVARRSLVGRDREIWLRRGSQPT
ncbi:hypothetical protein BH09ACT11_BH09ACT11_07240 [soil metagenome]